MDQDLHLFLEYDFFTFLPTICYHGEYLNFGAWFMKKKLLH